MKISKLVDEIEVGDEVFVGEATFRVGSIAEEGIVRSLRDWRGIVFRAPSRYDSVQVWAEAK